MALMSIENHWMEATGFTVAMRPLNACPPQGLNMLNGDLNSGDLNCLEASYWQAEALTAQKDGPFLSDLGSAAASKRWPWRLLIHSWGGCVQ
jgi:hypothetical protein